MDESSKKVNDCVKEAKKKFPKSLVDKLEIKKV